VKVESKFGQRTKRGGQGALCQTKLVETAHRLEFLLARRGRHHLNGRVEESIARVLGVAGHKAEAGQSHRGVERDRDLVPGLRHKTPEKGLSLISPGDAVVLVVLDRTLYGSWWVLVGNKKLNSAKLTILQLLNLALQRGVGADVLEETWLVVDPQFLFLLLALLVVLVQLANLGLDQVL